MKGPQSAIQHFQEKDENFSLLGLNTSIEVYMYILDDPATLRFGTVWLHGWGISVFPKTMISILLSVIIFTGRPFPRPTLKGARGAYKRHHGYNYSYHQIQNSYQLFRKPWFDTILLLILHVTPSNSRPYHCIVLMGWSLLPNALRPFQDLLCSREFRY